MQNTQNTIVKGEDFIRSFLISKFNKIIIDIDPNESKYKNTIVYNEWEEFAPTALHFIIWINVEEFTTEHIKSQLEHSSFLTTLCNSLNYPDFFGKSITLLNERTTIINKRQLDTKLFWDDIIALNKYLYGQSTAAIQAAQTPYNSLVQKLFINKDSIDKTVANMPKNYEAVYTAKKNEIQNKIDLLFTQINNLKSEIKLIEFDYINRVIKDDGNTVFSKLVNYLDKNKYVKGYRIRPSKTSSQSNRYKIDILLHSFPISYTVGEELLDKLINQSSRFNTFKNKEVLIDALSTRSNYEIYHRPILITLSVNISGDASLDYTINKIPLSYAELINLPPEIHNYFNQSNNFENRHHFRYVCLGGFKTDVLAAKASIEPIRLFATLFQYLSTINLADTAGNQWLEQNHLILNKKTGKLCLLKEKSGNLIELDCTTKDLDNLPLTDYYIKELPYGD